MFSRYQIPSAPTSTINLLVEVDVLVTITAVRLTFAVQLVERVVNDLNWLSRMIKKIRYVNGFDIIVIAQFHKKKEILQNNKD